MNQMYSQNSRDTLSRAVPFIRLENDSDLTDIYEFGKKLGQGSFGVVYEATHIETQTKWAIKQAGASHVGMLRHEMNILKQVNHAHIIHLQAIYHSVTTLYLVTELCEGGELKQLLQRKKFLTEDKTRNIICSLADAVVYLHKRDIVHRDLKLENILVKNSLDEDDGEINIKVTDFGLSVKTGGVGIENIMTEPCGTLIYMAPEVMSGRGYSQWCDMWSIGVVMYMLLCGEPPFVSKTKEGLLGKIKSQEIQFRQPIWDSVSDAAKNLLTCLLKEDPAYRMSASQLLENPWITGDTNVPAIPSNVLEMMRDELEQEQTEELSSDVMSTTSSEDTLASVPVPQAVSTGTGNSCTRHADRRPKSTFSSTTTDKQLQTGVKLSTQHNAKQQRPQDRKDLTTGHKSGSDSSKEDQRHSPSTRGHNSTQSQGSQKSTSLQSKTKNRAVSHKGGRN